MDRAERTLKIAICCYPTVGGSGVVATELGLALHARGHEIHFIATARPFRIPADAKGIRYHPVVIPSYDLFQYPSYGMSCACVMSEVAQKYGIDLFHVHYAYPHAVSGYLAVQMTPAPKPAVMATLHGTDIILAREQPCHERLVRFALEQANGVTAVSAYLRDQTRAIFDVDRELDVVHNFVDAEAFRPRTDDDTRRALAAPDEFVVVHVSNFRPIKRPIDVIETFRLVAAQAKARLVLVGDGPELGRVRDHVVRCGLEKSVTIAGERLRPSDVVAAADVFLLTSEQEGFGLAALEAMSCGVPVVSSRCGGIEEVVREGEDGFLAPPGQVTRLASAVLEIGRNQALRDRLGANARRRALETFGRDRAVAAYEQAYYRMLDRSRPR